MMPDLWDHSILYSTPAAYWALRSGTPRLLKRTLFAGRLRVYGGKNVCARCATRSAAWVDGVD